MMLEHALSEWFRPSLLDRNLYSIHQVRFHVDVINRNPHLVRARVVFGHGCILSFNLTNPYLVWNAV